MGHLRLSRPVPQVLLALIVSVIKEIVVMFSCACHKEAECVAILYCPHVCIGICVNVF